MVKRQHSRTNRGNGTVARRAKWRSMKKKSKISIEILLRRDFEIG